MFFAVFIHTEGRKQGTYPMVDDIPKCAHICLRDLAFGVLIHHVKMVYVRERRRRRNRPVGKKDKCMIMISKVNNRTAANDAYLEFEKLPRCRGFKVLITCSFKRHSDQRRKRRNSPPTCM